MLKLSFLSLFLLASTFQADPFQSLLSLQGTWEMKTSRGSIFEEWTQTDDKLLQGKSYLLKGADTVLLERIQLKEDGKNVYYIPTVQNQNNQQPIAFTMISSSESRFVFENKQHDFPQRIIYRFVTTDSIVARIEGTKNGKEQSSEFYFKRTKS